MPDIELDEIEIEDPSGDIRNFLPEGAEDGDYHVILSRDQPISPGCLEMAASEGWEFIHQMPYTGGYLVYLRYRKPR